MRTLSYNFELKTATAQILDVFNNIRIRRYDNQNSIQKTISVPCLYGNRSRILKSLENKNKTLKAPLIVISMGNVSRDSSRVHSVNASLMYQAGTTYDPLKQVPTPVNIEYEMSIITKYQEDMDQIISNFIPFMNPDIYVVSPHPKQPTINIKNQVVWNGDIDITWPDEISEDEPYRIIGTSNFTYKTWIWAGLSADGDTGPLIHRINFCPRLLPLGGPDSGAVSADANGTFYDASGNVVQPTDGYLGHMLDRWYDVPYRMTMDDYQEKIILGLVKTDLGRDNWDWLKISAGISGYWQDISGLVSGNVLGNNITGDPAFMTTDEGDFLVVADAAYLTPSMSAVNYYDYWLSTISGELSGC